MTTVTDIAALILAFSTPLPPCQDVSVAGKPRPIPPSPFVKEKP